jgi:hypothetical protein
VQRQLSKDRAANSDLRLVHRRLRHPDLKETKALLGGVGISELCSADASTGFGAPSIDAEYEAPNLRGPDLRVSLAAREQIVEERAIAAEKREVPKRLRCHRFEVGPTVRIRFAPAASLLRTRLRGVTSAECVRPGPAEFAETM